MESARRSRLSLVSSRRAHWELCIVERLELVDFRNYRTAVFELTAGVTAVLGRNGQGKTNLAEALGVSSPRLSSFRGAPPDAMIRVAADTAVIRATLRDDDGREVLIEAELSRVGRNRVQVNRQRLGKATRSARRGARQRVRSRRPRDRQGCTVRSPPLPR